MKTSRIRIGVAGLGRMGRIHARNIASGVRNAELTALCDVDPENLASVMRHLEVESGYASFPEMLEHREIDAVCIVTPSALHCEQIEQALEAGYHVFCEKPLSIRRIASGPPGRSGDTLTRYLCWDLCGGMIPPIGTQKR